MIELKVNPGIFPTEIEFYDNERVIAGYTEISETAFHVHPQGTIYKTTILDAQTGAHISTGTNLHGFRLQDAMRMDIDGEGGKPLLRRYTLTIKHNGLSCKWVIKPRLFEVVQSDEHSHVQFSRTTFGYAV